MRIKINNFGPIKEGFSDNDGFLDVKDVTVFIGNQGSGKSTVAKLISTFMWLEKDLYRSSITKEKSFFESELHESVEKLLSYHRVEDYFKKNTSIEYQGLAYNISFSNNKLTYPEAKNEFIYPQINYIPAERNLISYINNFRTGTLASWGLKDFIDQFNAATDDLERLEQILKLPINNSEVYSVGLRNLYLRGNDYSIKLSEASSGFQSVVPIILVSEYLLKKIINDNIREKNTLLKKKSFINIVEEPEQNLFPESQWDLLKSLLKCNNLNNGSKLIMTTHSPYIVNFLTIASQAYMLKNKIENAKNKNDLFGKLANIVPLDSTVSPDHIAIYEINDNGKISKLPTEYDIPSDNNLLNNELKSGNEIFDSLLEIEEEIEL